MLGKNCNSPVDAPAAEIYGPTFSRTFTVLDLYYKECLKPLVKHGHNYTVHCKGCYLSPSPSDNGVRVNLQ